MLKFMSHAAHRANLAGLMEDRWSNYHVLLPCRIVRIVSARSTNHRKDRERIDHNYRPRCCVPPFRLYPDWDGELYL
jgi:hypothetical protein